jgi:tetratricopeptide (TPR) repeat protein
LCALAIGAITLTAAVAAAKSYRVAGAIVHIKQQEYKAAIELLEAEVAEFPDGAEAYGYLGDAYAYDGQFMKAGQAWGRAEELYRQINKPKELEKIHKSRMFFWDKAFTEAQKVLVRAASFDKPDFKPEPGETREGDFDKAIEGLVATNLVFSAHPRSVNYLAYTYEVAAGYFATLPADQPVKFNDYDLATGTATPRELPAGEYAKVLLEKSLNTYETAVNVKTADMAADNFDSKTPLNEYVRSVANVAIQKGEYERALNIIDPLLAETPDDLGLLMAKALVCEKLGRQDETIEVYARVAAATPSDGKRTEIYGRIGNMYLDKDFKGYDPKKALDFLLKADAFAPDYRVWLNLGRAYKETGDTDKGVEYLKRGNDAYDAIQARLKEGKVVKVGDARVLVFGVWGPPEKVTRTGTAEEWVYTPDRGVTFENDKVTSVKGS